ncbi:MAG: nucleoside kinase [Candidatus Aureabacteria bacterium]|nr:nucleoside kinase [Candidatus Auribacterota bacterium]
MRKVQIFINKTSYTFPSGIKIGQLLRKTAEPDSLPFLGAVLYNRLVDPDYAVTHDCAIKPVTYQDYMGVAIYRRSATLILIQAVHDLFPGKRLVIGQSIADGYYFDLYLDSPLTPENVRAIDQRMRAIVEEDRPFVKTYLPYVEAKTYFEGQNLLDKTKLLDYLHSPEIPVVSCGDFFELYPGALAPSTGQIRIFALEPYQEGLVLRFPAWIKGWKLAPMRKEFKLFNVYRETRAWNKILSVENVGQLNELCVSGEIRELIIVAEALHEKKIAQIADEITKRGDGVKLVLIAGPSCSGKTTFTKRLQIELKVNGFHPVALSMDNYFQDWECTPRDESGDYDFEAMEAMDLRLLNEHLEKMLQGRSVETPIFDFKKGQRKEISLPIQLNPGRILIVEGIHALNDRVSSAVPPEKKFKIYVSALTQLCVDDHNRILTSDSRLLRRIVRDRTHRGWNVADTIRRWPSVRRGENRNIFPFQEDADIMFNSALVYEQAVLKNYAELALLEVTPDKAEYMEADRLLHFLSFFAPISERDVPSTSILREFIGGSFFEY